MPCEAPVMTATFLSMLISVLHLPCSWRQHGEGSLPPNMGLVVSRRISVSRQILFRKAAQCWHAGPVAVTRYGNCLINEYADAPHALGRLRAASGRAAAA